MKFPKYEKYIESGVEWLGEVPEHWDILPLRRLCESVKTGNTPSGVEDLHFDENDGMNWFSPSDFSDSLYLKNAKRKLSEEGRKEVRIFPQLSVMLVGIGATIGKVGLMKSIGSCNQQINSIVCNDKLNPKFATFYFKILKDYIVKCGKFTTMPIINQDETKSLFFAVPKTHEQISIADFLEKEIARIDLLIAKKKELVEKLHEQRSALISRTVTRGLPADVAHEFGLAPHTSFKPSGVDWLGDIPEGWDVKKLKFVFPPLKSGVSVNSDSIPADTESAGILKTSCVYGNRFRASENKRVVDDEIDRVACPVTENSLVISRMNTPDLVGSCGYVDKNYPNLFLPDRLWIARFSNGSPIHGKYAWFLVSSDRYVKLTGSLATGTSGSMKNLTQEAFLGIDSPIPPLSEQAAIVTYLDQETAKMDNLIEKTTEGIDRVQEYRSALITAAVTGKIDVRNIALNGEQ